jgi:hypothetical protein
MTNVSLARRIVITFVALLTIYALYVVALVVTDNGEPSKPYRRGSVSAN